MRKAEAENPIGAPRLPSECGDFALHNLRAARLPAPKIGRGA
jgi:hypothetical protein